ncbi:peptidogalycan biosysnthesis protein [Stappia stellulata]|uniref:peptidogalycan biosysnthesis protein n=1 Tax=Stappia stellulata TaxID=71235 RepID=UPI001AD90F8D|nr:peptidogalycan biosysnthesis protein [Stappia stellulata]
MAVCSVNSMKLGDVDEHEWDALVSDENFYNGYRWLKALGHALGETDVFIARGPAGLIAGCAHWEGEPSSEMFSLSHYVTDFAGPWHREFLWLGGRRNTHNEIACIQGVGRQDALAALGSYAADYAEEHGYAGFVMPYMPFGAAEEFANAVGGTAVLHSAEASLGVPEKGLADVLERMRKHDRVQCKSEISTFRRLGGEVEWVSLEEFDDAVAADLIAQNRSKYGSTQGREWMRRMLAGQRRAGISRLGKVAMSKRGQNITALTVFYHFGRALYPRYFGADYSFNLKDFRYFVLCYYESLDYAAANGFSKLRFSISALRAKVKRGAEIEPQAFVIKCVGGNDICPDDARRHNRRFLDRYHTDFAGHLSHDWNLIEARRSPVS